MAENLEIAKLTEQTPLMAHRKAAPPKSLTAEDRAAKSLFGRLLRKDIGATIDRMRVKGGKIILNADALFRILPAYEQDPEKRKHLGPLLYPVAKKFTNELFATLLKHRVTKNNTVVFTAGGSATGKSTILGAAGEQPGVDFVVDTTFSDPSRALRQVAMALRSGRMVEIHYVHRDFEESVRGMIERALDPASGRIVPIDDMARTHFGAQRSVLEVWQRYQDDERVAIRLSANAGAGKLRRLTEGEFEKRIYPSVDELAKLGQSILDEIRNQSRKDQEAAPNYNSGGESLRFSKAFYEAARSKTQNRRQAPV